jgi:hypothetical protein
MGVGILTDINGKVPQRAIRYIETLPYFVTYGEEAVDFGAGDSTTILATPAQFRGKVISVDSYNNSETFNSVTLAASVEIGDGTDQDGFAFTADFADGTDAQHFSGADGTITAGALGEIIQPADQVTITYVAPTGGTPTGISNVATTLLYFK